MCVHTYLLAYMSVGVVRLPPRAECVLLLALAARLSVG